jgi:TonB family protein
VEVAVRSTVISLGLLLVSLCVLPTLQTLAQTSQEEDCDGPVYAGADVSKRAKLLDAPPPQYTEEARAKGVRGTVILTAVFCRNGKITNITVIRSLPHGLTERAVESTRKIRFEAAQKDGEFVSQRFRRECVFNLY